MAIRHTLFATSLLVFLPLAHAGPSLKVVNGRVKEVQITDHKLVLFYRHPVSRRDEELILKIDERTGFGKRLHLEDLHGNDPVSVDYEENPGEIPRAIQVKRVDLNGVPEEIRHHRLL